MDKDICDKLFDLDIMFYKNEDAKYIMNILFDDLKCPVRPGHFTKELDVEKGTERRSTNICHSGV